MSITRSSFRVHQDEGGSTYTLAGLEVNLLVKSWLALLSSRRNTQRGARVLFQGRGLGGGDTYNLAHVGGVGVVIGMGWVYGMRVPACRGDEEVLAEVRWRRRSGVVFVGGVCESEGSCVLAQAANRSGGKL
jgi:hypothetical protein